MIAKAGPEKKKRKGRRIRKGNHGRSKGANKVKMGIKYPRGRRALQGNGYYG